MINDIARVLAQLSDNRLLRPVLLGLVASAIVLVALVGGSFWLLTEVVPQGESWIARQLEWIGFYELLGTFAIAFLALLLFPAVALTVQAMFVDSVTDAVEAKHYPHLPPGRSVPLGEALSATLRLTALVVSVNVLLLPVYLLLLLLPPTGFILYLAVNGYLIGREYFEIVGLRRHQLPELKTMRRRNRITVWLDGVLPVLFFSIPVINLAGPTLGTAYMVHRYHRVKTE
jgi:CysZ protein